MSTCAETRPLLAHRPLDALEDAELSAVDAHLDGCAACADHLEQLDVCYAELEGEPVEAALPDTLWAAIAQRIDEEPADEDEEPAEAAPSAALAIALVCTYCHDALVRPEARYCASCLAPHHADCFRGHGTCAAPGCEETHVVAPTLAVRPGERRRRRRGPAVWILTGLSALTLGGGLVARKMQAEQAALEAEMALREAAEAQQRVSEAARERDAAVGAGSRQEILLGALVRPTGWGLEVVEVLEGSRATMARLQRKDLILRIGAHPVRSLKELQTAMLEVVRNDQRAFTIVVRRNGRTHALIANRRLTAEVPDPAFPATVKRHPDGSLVLHVPTASDLKGQRYRVHRPSPDSPDWNTGALGEVRLTRRRVGAGSGWREVGVWSFETDEQTQLPRDTPLWLQRVD